MAITSDFKLKSNELTTAMLPHDDAKTAENTRKELQKQLVSVLKFDPSVRSKVVWVTDQGSNIVAALQPHRRLDCQDHIYNTVLRHALDITELSVTVPEVGGTLLAVKKVVHFSIKDVYVELHEKLESHGEAQRMADVSPDVLDFFGQFSPPLLRSPAGVGRKVQIQSLHKLAIFLWPKYNQLRMFCETERNAILQDAKSWIANYRATSGNATEEPAREVTSDTPPPAAKKRALSDFELEWENVAQGDVTAVEDEVHIYLNLNPSKEYDDRDLLGWWNQHAKTIPLLSRLALHVLSIPASSSSSELVFSTAGKTLEERSTSLKPSTVDAGLFLHSTRE
ncbi:unnamed protein product [Leuciscus chuanchicus]